MLRQDRNSRSSHRSRSRTRSPSVEFLEEHRRPDPRPRSRVSVSPRPRRVPGVPRHQRLRRQQRRCGAAGHGHRRAMYLRDKDADFLFQYGQDFCEECYIFFNVTALRFISHAHVRRNGWDEYNDLPDAINRAIRYIPHHMAAVMDHVVLPPDDILWQAHFHAILNHLRPDLLPDAPVRRDADRDAYDMHEHKMTKAIIDFRLHRLHFDRNCFTTVPAYNPHKCATFDCRADCQGVNTEYTFAFCAACVAENRLPPMAPPSFRNFYQRGPNNYSRGRR
jgi:hypothetical protein